MPIIIPRDGELRTAAPALTQEQRDKLWEQIVKNWAEMHPEAFANSKENYET